MQAIDRANNLRVTLPSTYRLASEAPPAPSRRTGASRVGPKPMPETPPPDAASSDAASSDAASSDAVSPGSELDALLSALSGQEMEVVGRETFEPTREPTPLSGVRRSGAESVPARQQITLDVGVGDDEEAVVLVEQDGVLSWHVPDARSHVSPSGVRRRGAAAGKHVTFHIDVHAERPTRAPRRRRGILTDVLFDRIRAVVFKFAAPRLADAAVSRLERNVRPGLVVMRGADPSAWPRVEDLAAVDLPNSRSPRLLLFVHGTFSSTVGGFGALGAYPWGRDLLDRAWDRYDAVVGFDHPTLSVDPRANATDLLRRLQPALQHGAPHVDIVTHSRGGLVFRSLVDHVLPSTDGVRPHVDRAVFVGVPNAGTTLAHPDHWRDLVDLYTNLAVATCKALGLIPQVTFVAVILKELVQGLGALVKHLATHATDERGVPGLASMHPEGDFIRDLAREQPGQPSVDTTFYCAITSNFEAQIDIDEDEHEPKELPKRLAMRLVDGAVDRLFPDANDLVVDTASMTAIDVRVGAYVKDHLDLGTNAQVYHTNYFTRPEVTRALVRWLNLREVEARPEGAPRRRADGPAAPYPVVDPGAVVSRPVPARVRTDVVVTTSDASVQELRDALEASASDFVVVQRPHEGRVLNYAYARAESLTLLSGGAADDASLLDAFAMRETQASDDATWSDVAAGADPTTTADRADETSGEASDAASDAGALHERPRLRRVLVDDGAPLGVVPEPAPLPTSTEVAVEAAREMLADGGLTMTTDEPERSFRRRSGDGAPGEMQKPDAADALDGADEQATPDADAPDANAPDDAPADQPTVYCNVYAELPAEVQVGATATLVVSLSRDAIEHAADAATASGGGAVDPTRRIILDVRARRNVALASTGRVELSPPGPGATVERYFDVHATHTGEGEVWVTARQGQVPLVTLKLAFAIRGDAPAKPRPAHAEASASVPPPSEPLRQLKIFERVNGTQVRYDYVLELPGVMTVPFSSDPLPGDRQTYVDALYAELEARWLSQQVDEDNFVEEVQALGAELFTELFPPEMQRLLWAHRTDLDSIQVFSTEPFIPWELVHLSEPGEPLTNETWFLGELGMVRWLYGGWPSDTIRIRNGRVRYVVPDYPHPDDALPSTKDEAAYLRDTFDATPVTPNAGPVRRALKDEGAFDLIHFACHGEAEHDNTTNAKLVLEGRVENGYAIPDALSAATVRAHKRLRGPDGTRAAVFVNACKTGRQGRKLTNIGGFAEAFLSGTTGAGAFVGALWSVDDRAALDFTTAFYDALLDGATLSEASVVAREAARSSPDRIDDASWLAYVVYGHPHARLVRT